MHCPKGKEVQTAPFDKCLLELLRCPNDQKGLCSRKRNQRMVTFHVAQAGERSHVWQWPVMLDKFKQLFGSFCLFTGCRAVQSWYQLGRTAHGVYIDY